MFFEVKDVDIDTEISLYKSCFYDDKYNFESHSLDGVEDRINSVVQKMHKKNYIFIVIEGIGKRRMPYLDELRLLYEYNCKIGDDPDRFPKDFLMSKGIVFNQNFEKNLGDVVRELKQYFRPATAEKTFEVRFFFSWII